MKGVVVSVTSAIPLTCVAVTTGLVFIASTVRPVDASGDVLLYRRDVSCYRNVQEFFNYVIKHAITTILHS